jgi:NAD(P)-dependent dehydrogenase (short-subunit alcohol dehydrogenase family)
VIGDRLRLDGRTIVVAGAGGGGIGTAVCTAAAELGANVVGLDKDESALAAAEVAVAGRFRGILADVQVKDEVDAGLADAVAEFGQVDGLVHVVGGQQPRHWQPADDFAVSDLDEVLALNLRSALLTSQAAARTMTAAGRGGSIVHIASVAAFFAAPFNLAYSAAKAALISLTRTTATEWGSRNIRVNAVAAGTIRTPHSRGNDAADSARDSVLSLRRRGTPQELAGAVVFLLSDLAGFITGHTLVVDGGSVIRPSYLGPDNIPVFMEDGDLRSRLTP